MGSQVVTTVYKDINNAASSFAFLIPSFATLGTYSASVTLTDSTSALTISDSVQTSSSLQILAPPVSSKTVPTEGGNGGAIAAGIIVPLVVIGGVGGVTAAIVTAVIMMKKKAAALAAKEIAEAKHVDIDLVEGF